MENFGYETRGKKRPKIPNLNQFHPQVPNQLLTLNCFNFLKSFFNFWKTPKINQKQYHLKTPPKKNETESFLNIVNISQFQKWVQNSFDDFLSIFYSFRKQRDVGEKTTFFQDM